MKTILFFLLITPLLMWSQIEVPTSDQIQSLLKTTTCVVLDDNPFSETNIQLSAAVKNFWKLTPFEIISVEEYEKRKKISTYSFLSVDEVYFDNNKNPIRYKFLCLYLGGNYKTDSEMPQICTIPLAYVDEEESHYAFKIGTFILFIQNHIHNIQQNPQLKKSNIFEYYKQQKGSLENKTLWLIKDEVEPKLRNENYFKTIYPYKFKFVSREELEQAIDVKNPEIIFLHKVGVSKSGSKTYKILINTEGTSIYYFDSHTVNDQKPNTLLESDIKNLTK
ncbi:MAG: hypothetical protein N2449_03135 [Bacteroidales bacterium]|nr:hypothetical protein [Bacteroidales bacterium]